MDFYTGGSVSPDGLASRDGMLGYGPTVALPPPPHETDEGRNHNRKRQEEEGEEEDGGDSDEDGGGDDVNLLLQLQSGSEAAEREGEYQQRSGGEKGGGTSAFASGVGEDAGHLVSGRPLSADTIGREASRCQEPNQAADGRDKPLGSSRGFWGIWLLVAILYYMRRALRHMIQGSLHSVWAIARSLPTFAWAIVQLLLWFLTWAKRCARAFKDLGIFFVLSAWAGVRDPETRGRVLRAFASMLRSIRRLTPALIRALASVVQGAARAAGDLTRAVARGASRVVRAAAGFAARAIGDLTRAVARGTWRAVRAMVWSAPRALFWCVIRLGGVMFAALPLLPLVAATGVVMPAFVLSALAFILNMFRENTAPNDSAIGARAGAEVSL